MSKQEKTSGGRAAAKFLVSTALVAVSAAYGYWQNAAQSSGAAPRKTTTAAAPAVPVAAPAAAQSVIAPLIPTPAETQTASFDAPKAPTVEAPVKPAAQVPPPSVATAQAVVAEAAPAGPPVAANGATPGRKRFTFSDGEFTGDTADSEWGPVQVKVAIREGYIVDVNFLQAPGHRDRSAEITDRAAPILVSEAIKDQYYDVDIVTSATFTSIAFQRTLYTALIQAQK